MNTVFHESYGDVLPEQLRLYRKHNVSPSDHNDLASVYGEDNHAAIIAAVKRYQRHGLFSVFDFWNRRPL